MSLTSRAPQVPLYIRFASFTGISAQGEKKTFQIAEDSTLFDVLVEAGYMKKSGTCAGNMACGKCLVKQVEGPKPDMEDEEREILEEAPKDARLACAIQVTDDLDGAVFKVI